MEQTEAKEIYQMGVEALNDCDYRMAGAYFQNAAKMNYKPAIAALEKLILEGKYKNVQSKQTLSSNTESKELFEKGVDYYQGRNNTKIDYVKAFECFLSSSIDGYAFAMNWLGYCYEYGKGTKKNLDSAFGWYEKAANANVANAIYHLGRLYYDGKGVQQDYNKAFGLFKKACDLRESKAYEYLADCYFYGQGTKINYEKALQFYLKVKPRGVIEYKIGYIYARCLSTGSDYPKAAEHFQKGIDFGNTKSMINLGILYYKGKGIQQDYYKAFELFKKASDLENKTAYAWLAECYYYGNGTQKDYQKALQLYLKGNLYGYTQRQIGRIYESGQDVKKNLTEALNWYKKANESGEDCKADIERINNLLNKKPENKSIDKTKVETKANSNKPIKAYEGDKPYIFVSYSHTDSKVVKEVLQMLINQGYRIWFDEGIRAGSSWTENLMNHIKNASHFIFFLSRHSINSKYCLKELRFADRRNKIIIPICIENVNVSDEIDFLLGEVQMLFKNNLEKEEFMEKFNSSNHIEICSR